MSVVIAVLRSWLLGISASPHRQSPVVTSAAVRSGSAAARVLVGVCLAATITCAPGAATSIAGDEAPRVGRKRLEEEASRAMARGRAWLAGKMRQDGSWHDTRFAASDVGITALSAHALGGIAGFESKVAAARRFLLAKDGGYGVHELATTLICLGGGVVGREGANRVGAPVLTAAETELVGRALRRLVRCQSRGTGRGAGGFGYQEDPEGLRVGLVDNVNTWFAMQGIASGISIVGAVEAVNWEGVLQSLQAFRARDRGLPLESAGAVGYSYREGAAQVSVTLASVGSLALCRMLTGSQVSGTSGVDVRAAVASGMAWLLEHPLGASRRGFGSWQFDYMALYWLAIVAQFEECGPLRATSEYAGLCNRLIMLQDRSGCWGVGAGRSLDTPLAILTLELVLGSSCRPEQR